VRGDLLSSLLPRVAGEVDVLIFNPPYVPTDEEECVIKLVLLIRRLQTQTQQGIGGAWAGGALGMTVTNRLLGILPVGSAQTPSHRSPSSLREDASTWWLSSRIVRQRSLHNAARHLRVE